MDEWYACVGKDEQEFIKTWNRLENRIRIIEQDIDNQVFTIGIFSYIQRINSLFKNTDIGKAQCLPINSQAPPSYISQQDRNNG
ncbi:hypothetical protein DLAC_00123 [Tieghemostelium lacteum]|uniref:Uncharacterized protein n=1 Tax=Tieghemostelium lacteum TaxID=361077 RepID=A0A152A8X0_TIELA|nr:hypothetical protein DLAC_00123 [Tieghemostelium lacteum]|eukprot:KYR02668.1 hypothetical protein DLAC_00123 [Tieghemostelium lacteum]